MPEIFPFIAGTESSLEARQHGSDTSPLLGRFRAMPNTSRAGRKSRSGLAADGRGGSMHIGYGALMAAGVDDGDEEDYSDVSESEDDGLGRRLVRRGRRGVRDLWIKPRQGAVKRVVDNWWGCWGMLVLLPATLAVAWCAIPIPQYPLPAKDGEDGGEGGVGRGPDDRVPGHGEAQVRLNFWFFLFVYYGLYNLVALIWITKVFNIYSLNWWPQSLGFLPTVSLIAVASLAVPIPIYMVAELRFLTVHNTAWISWSFVIMAMPVGIAFCIMLLHERHLGLRQSLSETQRIFTSSWWRGEAESLSGRNERRRVGLSNNTFQADAVTSPQPGSSRNRMTAMMRRRWLPASFVRFLWFCLALIVGLLAYLIGEAYAEIYLRTLPHNSLETIVYVWSWVVTVHVLDMLTGWILGASEGERVGSYPLSWIFKLYFMLTYQTYVRALYARLRSPRQFILLQILSSSSLILLTPINMSRRWHGALTFLNLSGQSYAAYQKTRIRDVFIRFLAENVSMVAFLGSILVLHYGPNRDVYPYFAFDDPTEPYDFNFTFYASTITWACELVAALVSRGLIRCIYGVDAGLEGKSDMAVWPELLATSVVLMLHVLQNSLFSIIRLHFR